VNPENEAAKKGTVLMGGTGSYEEIAAEAGLQPLDEGVVAERAAGALVATKDVDLVLVGRQREQGAPVADPFEQRRRRHQVVVADRLCGA